MSSTPIVRLLGLRTQKGAQVDINAPQLLRIAFSEEITVDPASKNQEADVRFFHIADFELHPKADDIDDLIKNIDMKHPAPSEAVEDELRFKIAGLLRNLISEMDTLFNSPLIEHGPSITEFIEVCCANKTAVCGIMRKIDGRFQREVLPHSNSSRLVPGAIQSYYKQQTLS